MRPSFCELIFTVREHIDAEAQAAVIRYLAANTNCLVNIIDYAAIH